MYDFLFSHPLSWQSPAHFQMALSIYQRELSRIQSGYSSSQLSPPTIKSEGTKPTTVENGNAGENDAHIDMDGVERRINAENDEKRETPTLPNNQNNNNFKHDSNVGKLRKTTLCFFHKKHI